MLKLIEFHSFAPISVLPDAMLLAFLPPPPLTFGGGGYLDIVPGGTKLAAVHFSPAVRFIIEGYSDIVPGGTKLVVHACSASKMELPNK